MIKPRHRHVHGWGVEGGRHHDAPHLGRVHGRHHHRHHAGMWVRVPHTHGYKRYTRVLTAHITQSIAGQIQLFGGTTLAAFLRDRYGITGEVDAPVHLYEALPGTTLGRIAAHERRVRGLGHARAYWKLQPLTPEVAGLLLGEPGLGHAVEPEFLSRPQKIAVGERFYYLELRGRGAHRAGAVAVLPGAVAIVPGGQSVVAGAPVVVTVPGAPAAGGPEAGRSSELNIRVNFPAHEIVVSQYLSDADAQTIATAAVKSGPIPAATELRRPVHHGLKLALSSTPHGHLRWIVAAPTSGVPPNPGSEAPLVLADRASAHRVRVKVREWVDAALIGFVNQRRQEFVAVAQRATQGVTLVVRLGNVPGMERLLAHPEPGGAVGGGSEPFGPGAPTVTVELVQGFRGA
jgi:hypothetical protein